METPVYDPENTPQGVDPAEAVRLADSSLQRVEEAQERFPNLAPHDESQGHCFSSDEILKALKANEVGDSDLMVALGHGRFCFDHSTGDSFLWRENWQMDRIKEVFGLLEEVVALYSGEARRQGLSMLNSLAAGDKEGAARYRTIRDALERRISQLQTKQRAEAVLKMATWGLGSMGISGLEWDTKPSLLAVQNGTIELETGRFRKSRREDYLRTVAPTPWQGPDAPRDRWEKFVLEIFGDDQELADYFRRLIGYGLSGAVVEHVLPVLWGTGRNGKGLALETIARVLGGLACPIQSELLLASTFSKASGGPSSEILNLRGRRIVWSSETDENRKLNAARIKSLTGGDSLCGRHPYGKHEINFVPSHLLMLLTNFKPKANSDDHALWARLHVIPFTVCFTDHPEGPNEKRRDPRLAEKLEAEAPGILAWAVRGYLEWKERGLDPPAVVRAATASYRQDEDLLGQFISERCIQGEKATVKGSNLYAAYKAWAEEMGLRPLSGTMFGKRMKDRFDSVKHGVVSYLGIGLRNDE